MNEEEIDKTVERLFRSLRSACSAAKRLENAEREIAGFKEYCKRKNRRYSALGFDYESGIIDFAVDKERRSVFCVLGYFNKTGTGESITCFVFQDRKEYASRAGKAIFRTDDLIYGYQGILLAELPAAESKNRVAEMIVKVRGKQVYFDIPLE